MKLTWLPEHSVGIGVLDLQHQQIISLCNKAHDAIEHDDEYLLHEIINDLMNVARSHFEFEEREMIRYKVPGADTHSNHHKQYMEELIEMLYSALYSSTTLKDVQEFIVKWFFEHMTVHDADLRRYFCG